MNKSSPNFNPWHTCSLNIKFKRRRKLRNSHLLLPAVTRDTCAIFGNMYHSGLHTGPTTLVEPSRSKSFIRRSDHVILANSIFRTKTHHKISVLPFYILELYFLCTTSSYYCTNIFYSFWISLLNSNYNQ